MWFYDPQYLIDITMYNGFLILLFVSVKGKPIPFGVGFLILNIILYGFYVLLTILGNLGWLPCIHILGHSLGGCL